MSDADSKAAKKAAKKVARELERQQQEQTMNVEVPDEADDEAARKAAKKAAKKAKKQAEKVAAEESVPAEEDEEELKKQRKAAKKAKKAKQDAEVDGSEEPAAKKQKKSSGAAGSSVGSARVNYVMHADTAAMTADEAAAHREKLEMAIYPPEMGDEYYPLTAFDQLAPSLGNYCSDVSNYIRVKGFKIPSPIQSQCWPLLLAGHDVIGIAATGSGKTMAFLVPALLKIAKHGETNSAGTFRKGKAPTPKPQVLIMAPTRELAMQSHQVVAEIAAANESKATCQSVRGVCIYGGVSKAAQRAELQLNPQVVVATPGRLQDLVDEGAMDLSEVRYAVLDEADRMLDEGFEPAIRKIMSYCATPAASPGAPGRQTVMFSATWPEEIRALASKYLNPDAIRVTVGSEDLSANHRVTQIVECVDASQKDSKLMGLLQKYHKSRTNRCLLFVLYKREADNLERVLLNRGYKVVGIHGDKSQEARTAALEEFKSGRTPLMIATDVAARGLDIPQVEYVINYSFPLTVEDYVHRIGRTGRAGNFGISHTFFTDFDKGLAGALVGVLKDANQEIPQDIYKYPMITKKKTSKLYGDFGPKADLAGKKATKITFD